MLGGQTQMQRGKGEKGQNNRFQDLLRLEFQSICLVNCCNKPHFIFQFMKLVVKGFESLWGYSRVVKSNGPQTPSPPPTVICAHGLVGEMETWVYFPVGCIMNYCSKLQPDPLFC